jgi:hypothetical protein
MREHGSRSLTLFLLALGAAAAMAAASAISVQIRGGSGTRASATSHAVTSRRRRRTNSLALPVTPATLPVAPRQLPPRVAALGARTRQRQGILTALERRGALPCARSSPAAAAGVRGRSAPAAITLERRAVLVGVTSASSSRRRRVRGDARSGVPAGRGVAGAGRSVRARPEGERGGSRGRKGRSRRCKAVMESLRARNGAVGKLCLEPGCEKGLATSHLQLRVHLGLDLSGACTGERCAADTYWSQ